MHIDLERNKLDWSVGEILAIASLISSPFTAFRLGYLGISEVMLIDLIIYYIVISQGKVQLQKAGLAKYYFLFLFFCLIGWAYNYLTGINSGTLYYAVVNLTAYSVSAMVMMSTDGLCQNNSKARFRPSIILRSFFVILSFIILFLYFISRTRRSLFGISLFYYNRFVPLADNIHQFAMITVILPFIGFYNVYNEKRPVFRLVYLFLAVFDIYITIGIIALKATAGIIFGCATMILLPMFNSRHIDYRSKLIIAIVLIASVLVAVIVKYDALMYYGQRFFSENDNHGARSNLYSEAIEIVLNKSYFVGLGPSLHVRYGASYGDIHETFLTALVSGGLGGLLSVCMLYWKAAKRVFCNTFCFSAMVPIIIYSLGGDMLRKYSVWMIIVLLVALSKQNDYSAVA